tara:strand:+ start:305 stop:586 length:282 start_codon:yes stop_codon:yes gene_type:complete
MKTITLQFEDIDWQVLEDGIVDPTQWIQNAANVKMGKVKKQILVKEQARLLASERKTMPASVDGLVESYFAQDGYMNAAERYAAAALEEDPTL